MIVQTPILKTVLFSILLVISFVIIPSGNVAAAGNEIYVDDSFYLHRDGTAEHPYASIQYAIDIADEDDTIYVFGGTYNETLTINKKIRLIGSIDDGDTIISYGKSHQYTVKITADYVTFESFTLRDTNNNIISISGALLYLTSDNTIIQGNNITQCRKWGIYLDSSHDNTIGGNSVNFTKGVYLSSSNNNVLSNNNFSNCTEAGIKLLSAGNNIIYHNLLNFSNYGIYEKDCSHTNISSNTIHKNIYHGIAIYQSSDTIVEKNRIYENNVYGIHLNAHDCKITKNSFEGNQVSINLDESDNTIRDNYINTSVSSGVYAQSGSKNNIIYQNHFNENTVNARENGNNQWDNGTAGNYWDDYNEVDRNKDGIGDEVYRISGGGRDHYPLGIFLRPPKKPSNPSPADEAENVGLRITLEVKVTDPDREIMDVYFYNAIDETLLEKGIDRNVLSGDIASVTLSLAFDTTFAWYTVANDSRLENRSDIWFFVTKGRPPENEKPVADPGGPYTAGLGDTVIFDASASYDPDGDIDFYRWNFGDGSSEIIDTAPDHVYNDPGSYEVVLTVVDNNGTSATATTMVTIGSAPSNKLPVADTGGPYNGTADGTITFDGTGSYDLDGNIVNYTWEFGDGTRQYGIVTTRTYADAGTHLVTLTVTDDDDASATASTTITVEAPEESPGFELVCLLVACGILVFFRRRNLV